MLMRKTQLTNVFFGKTQHNDINNIFRLKINLKLHYKLNTEDVMVLIIVTGYHGTYVAGDVVLLPAQNLLAPINPEIKTCLLHATAYENVIRKRQAAKR